MKVVILENQKKDAIFRYFDMIKKSGELPTIKPFLDMFGVNSWDSDEYFEMMVDYHGGFENAVELAKKIALDLKDVPFESSIGDGNLFFTITRSYLSHRELAIEVECYGELFNMEIYKEEEDQNEVVERISLSDYYDFWDDISEGQEVRDIISSDITDVLVKEITYKTGIECYIDYVHFT
jgi:hypothetical protein